MLTTILRAMFFLAMLLTTVIGSPLASQASSLMANSRSLGTVGNLTAASNFSEIPGSSRRGIAYNNADYVPLFSSPGRHTTWCYNWDSRPYRDAPVEFVPMLHSLHDDHTSIWQANALAAINGNRNIPTHLLAFNEPDNCM